MSDGITAAELIDLSNRMRAQAPATMPLDVWMFGRPAETEEEWAQVEAAAELAKAIDAP